MRQFWHDVKLFAFMCWNWCMIAFAIILLVGVFYPTAFAQRDRDGRDIEDLSHRVETLESQTTPVEHRLTAIESAVESIQKSEEENAWMPKGTLGAIALLIAKEAYVLTKRRIREEDSKEA